MLVEGMVVMSDMAFCPLRPQQSLESNQVPYKNGHDDMLKDVLPLAIWIIYVAKSVCGV